MKKSISIISIVLAVILMFSACSSSGGSVNPDATAQSAYDAVEAAYGDSYPIGMGDELTPEEVGVTEDMCAEYVGVQLTTSTEKYVVFIAKANDGSVNDIKSALDGYITNEGNSMNSYLSEEGKKLFSNAKVETKGNFAYLVMVDTDSNTTAIEAIEGALS